MCCGEMLQSLGINGRLLKYIQEFHFQTDNEKHFGFTIRRFKPILQTTTRKKVGWCVRGVIGGNYHNTLIYKHFT